MMWRLDNRGMAAFEFILIFVPLFTLIFAIFDLGRYTITQQSLNALADAGARAVMIQCYTPNVIANTSPSGCTNIATYMPTASMQNAAPFLFFGGLTPTLNVTAGANALTVTASQPNFAMLMPIWQSTGLVGPNGLSATTSIPF